MEGKSLIGYARVSTSQQGELWPWHGGAEAGPDRFAEAEGFTLTRLIVEVETGKGADAMSGARSLRAALSEARRQALRYGRRQVGPAESRRSLHFSGLMTHRVPFVVAELGSRRRSVHPSPVRGAG